MFTILQAPRLESASPFGPRWAQLKWEYVQMDRLGATLTMLLSLYEREVDEIQKLSPFFEATNAQSARMPIWIARPGLEARLRDALQRAPMVTLMGPRQTA
jgi:hypothetical protein